MYDPNPPNPLAKTAAEWTDRSSAWSKFQPGAPSEALIITLDVVDESLWSVPAPGLKAAVEDLLEVIKSIRKSYDYADDLKELCTLLDLLRDSIIEPIKKARITEDVQARIDRLASDLGHIKMDYEQTSRKGRLRWFLESFAFSHADNIFGLNRMLKPALETFMAGGIVHAETRLESLITRMQVLQSYLPPSPPQMRAPRQGPASPTISTSTPAQSSNSTTTGSSPLQANHDTAESTHQVSSSENAPGISPCPPGTSLSPSTSRQDVESDALWEGFLPSSQKFTGYSRRSTEESGLGRLGDVAICYVKLRDGGVKKAALRELFNPNTPTLQTDSKVVGRMIVNLHRNLNVWGRLYHPHVAPVIGIQVVPTSVIREWYSNGDVTAWVKNHPEIEKRELVLQAAAGIAYLHSLKIIHGDIRPENVLINDEGKVVIVDYGLHQIMEDMMIRPVDFSTSLTYIPPNMRWLAPEIVCDGKKRSMESDVYGFGCLMLEIETGAPPFDKLTDFQLKQVMLETYPLVTYRPAYPNFPKDDPLWDLMACCCHHETESRPTMKTVEDKLRSQLGQNSQPTLPPRGLDPRYLFDIDYVIRMCGKG